MIEALAKAVTEVAKEGVNKEARDLPDFAKNLKPEYIKDFKEANEPICIKTVNSDLIDSNHPVTDIEYKKREVDLPDGRRIEGVFPDFPNVFETKLKESEYLLSDKEQFAICNKALYEKIKTNPEFAKRFTEEQTEDILCGFKPEGYTWHHNEKAGVMQLVDTEVHSKTPHTGGRAIWGGGKDCR